ncbi:putative uncharacterized protein DDB_G0282133 [Microplitis mediator]|uniref:putative uncharacterized protein DDB_G0282133 n=1 Tax=Microplitis mediator TaxID=375433 RepID=UPI00255384CB|nr:putative uncharacterized protein DDB_G0282133 [Microplitis mediator]
MNVDNVHLPIGSLFFTYSDYECWFTKLQKNEEPTRISSFDTKTIAGARLKKNMNPNLKKYKLHYICEFGMKFKSKGKTSRRTSSKKIDCPFFFKFLINKTGDALELKSCNWIHNHPSGVLQIDKNAKTQEENVDVHELTEETINKTVDNDSYLNNTNDLLNHLDDLSFIYADDYNDVIEEDGIGDLVSDKVYDVVAGKIVRVISGIPEIIVRNSNNKIEVNNNNYNNIPEYFDNLKENGLVLTTVIPSEISNNNNINSNVDGTDGGNNNKIEVNNNNDNKNCPRDLEKRRENDLALTTVNPGEILSINNINANVNVTDDDNNNKIEIINNNNNDSPKDFDNEEENNSASFAVVSNETKKTENTSITVLSTIHYQHTNSLKKKNITDINSINMPKISTKGRPKGKVLSAIGLPIPKNNKRNQKNFKNLTSFINLSVMDQTTIILGWIVDSDLVKDVLNKKKKVSLNDLHESFPDSLVDDEVNLNIIHEYLEKPVIKRLNYVIIKKRQLNYYTCDSCSKEVKLNSIRCDLCLKWYHYKCQSLKKSEATKISEGNIYWFCAMCQKK